MGYADMPRGFADVNGDNKADLITFRGQHENQKFLFTYLMEEVLMNSL